MYVCLNAKIMTGLNQGVGYEYYYVLRRSRSSAVLIMFITIIVCNTLLFGWRGFHLGNGYYQRQVVGLDRLEMAIKSRCKRFSLKARDSKSNNINSPLALIHIPKGRKKYHVNCALQSKHII